MPGGKRKLAQLFTSKVKTGANGTWINQILSGSVAFDTAGLDEAAADMGACYIAEVTITNMSPCDMLMGTVWGMSACYKFNGELLAGDGQASIVYRFVGSPVSGSVDANSNGLLRYINLKGLGRFRLLLEPCC